MATFDSVLTGLRDRASQSRRVYNLSVAAMLSVTISLVVLYLFGSQTTVNIANSTVGDLSLLFIVSNAIVRIGAVAVGIYAVQITFNLARYHIKVAHHLDAAADALELCDGDLSKIDILQRALAPQTIDFGKAPPALSDKALDLIKEIASKLPTTAK